jgi:hypothetical protein
MLRPSQHCSAAEAAFSTLLYASVPGSAYALWQAKAASLQFAGRAQVERAAQRAARPHSAGSAQAMAGRLGGSTGSVSALASSPGAAAHAVTAGWGAPLPAVGGSALAALEGADPPAAPAPAALAPPGTRATRITPTSTARRTLAEVNARAPTYTGVHLNYSNCQGTGC